MVKKLVNLILEWRKVISIGVVSFIAVFHIAEFFYPVPIKSLPDLWLVINNAFCLACILFMFIYGHLLMFLACDPDINE